MIRSEILIFAEEVPPATREALVERGMEVSKAESLDDALELAGREFDCILGVPERDDVASFVTDLKNGFPDCPIILSIADGPKPGVEDRLEPGVLDYVRPTDLREHGEIVAHRIETAITASQQPTELEFR